MTIGEERTMAMEIHPPKKIPSGIEGFEHLTLGGLPEGRTTLAVGTSG
jgi:circadian clock protein KaiC